MERTFEKQKNFISAIVYLNNDENIIREFIRKVDEFLFENFIAYEIVIVNNASIDKSVDTIKTLKGDIKGKITIVNLSWRHTKDIAMISGHDIAIGDYVIEFDKVSLEIPLHEVYNAYQISLRGYDIVAGAPKHSDSKGEKIFYKLLKTFSKPTLELQSESFRILSRRVINRVFKELNGFIYRKALYRKSGFEYFIYVYDGNEIKRKETLSSDIKLAINTLLKYTNLFVVLPWMFIILFFVSLIIPVFLGKIYIFLIILFLSIVSTFSIIYKMLVDISKGISKERLYVFKSIDRL